MLTLLVLSVTIFCLSRRKLGLDFRVVEDLTKDQNRLGLSRTMSLSF